MYLHSSFLGEVSKVLQNNQRKNELVAGENTFITCYNAPISSVFDEVATLKRVTFTTASISAKFGNV